MKYFIVYQTTNLINNKIYIGVHKTINPDIFDGYIGCGVYVNSPSSYLYPNSPFLYAVKKYGPGNFRRVTLQVFNSAEEAYNLESELVNKNFLHRKDTYNIQLGGLITGHRMNTTFQFDENGVLLKEWDNLIEASEFYGISKTAILHAVKFKESSFGYYWSYDKEIKIEEYSKMNKGTIIYVYDSENGKYLGKYDSVPLAAKCLNCRNQDILRAILGGYKVNNYYFSKNLNEIYQGKPKISLKNKIIYVYNLNGEFEFQGNSKDVKNYLNLNTINPISVSLRTERPYKKWQFSLEKVEFMPKVINKRNISKKIGRYNLKTNELLETFDSISLAVNIYGTGVLRVLKGQQSHCKGFMFKFIID